jgi:hypothetical protein
MNAVEFDATAVDGKIEIPNQYQNIFSTHIKVILLKQENMRNTKTESAWDKTSGLFPDLRSFTNDEATAYKNSLSTLFKKTGRRIF